MKIAKFMTDKSRASVLFLTVFYITCLYQAKAQKTGTFTDPRDGETYTTIKIEDPAGTKVTWLAQNLRYLPAGTANSWAYDNQEKYVQNLGRLYTWYAALKACPRRWRLPSNTDWNILISAFGADKNANALKSTKGWTNGGNGSNTSGFSGLPGGYRNSVGEFDYLGSVGVWWSSSEGSSNYAWWLGLNNSSGNVNRNYYGKESGLSVRCLRD
jgi:uncharacterized protein (TIGR02145 family)